MISRSLVKFRPPILTPEIFLRNWVEGAPSRLLLIFYVFDHFSSLEILCSSYSVFYHKGRLYLMVSGNPVLRNFRRIELSKELSPQLMSP